MRVLDHPFERKSLDDFSGPGVYVFCAETKAKVESCLADPQQIPVQLSEALTVLYVGKAKTLKNRLRTYCVKGSAAAGDWHKANKLNSSAGSVLVLPCPSHFEACLLELFLIRLLSPKLNFMSLGSGKIYYIQECKSSGELVVSQKRRAGFKSWGFLRQRAMIEYAFDAFARVLDSYDVVSCEVAIAAVAGTQAGLKRQKRLRLSIGKDKSEVAKALLRGKKNSVLKGLWKKMREAAQNQQFHHAAQLRDMFFALRQFQLQLKRSRRISRLLKNARFIIGDSAFGISRSYSLHHFSLQKIAQEEGNPRPEENAQFILLMSSAMTIFRKEYECKTDLERLKVNFEFLRLMLWWHDNKPEPCSLRPADAGL